MLHLFLFVLTSPPTHLPISPSIMAMAMSNIDGLTPNHLFPQMYGTTVLDEDVEFSDKELELIAGGPEVVKSYTSDLILHGHVIMSYREFEQFMRSHPDGWQQITFIQDKIKNNGINITQTVAAVIWQNLRDTAPIQIKHAHQGFIVNLNTGQLTYIH